MSAVGGHLHAAHFIFMHFALPSPRPQTIDDHGSAVETPEHKFPKPWVGIESIQVQPQFSAVTFVI